MQVWIEKYTKIGLMKDPISSDPTNRITGWTTGLIGSNCLKYKVQKRVQGVNETDSVAGFLFNWSN